MNTVQTYIKNCTAQLSIMYQSLIISQHDSPPANTNILLNQIKPDNTRGPHRITARLHSPVASLDPRLVIVDGLMKSEARGLRSNYSNACARYTIY